MAVAEGAVSAGGWGGGGGGDQGEVDSTRASKYNMIVSVCDRFVISSRTPVVVRVV